MSYLQREGLCGAICLAVWQIRTAGNIYNFKGKRDAHVFTAVNEKEIISLVWCMGSLDTLQYMMRLNYS